MNGHVCDIEVASAEELKGHSTFTTGLALRGKALCPRHHPVPKSETHYFVVVERSTSVAEIQQRHCTLAGKLAPLGKVLCLQVHLRFRRARPGRSEQLNS